MKPIFDHFRVAVLHRFDCIRQRSNMDLNIQFEYTARQANLKRGINRLIRHADRML